MNTIDHGTFAKLDTEYYNTQNRSVENDNSTMVKDTTSEKTVKNHNKRPQLNKNKQSVAKYTQNKNFIRKKNIKMDQNE